MKQFVLLIFIVFFSFKIIAQPISGVINNYTAISNIVGNVLTVTSSTAFAVGDKVMVIKMKGATINQTNTAAYGDTISLGEAGRYAISFVVAKTPTTVTLSPFCDVFADNNYLQLVSIPIYPNPTVNAPLNCLPWNGTIGGILIFETPGTLTLNENIIVSENGYRGGDDFGNLFSCNQTNYFEPLSGFPAAGEKGEAAADYIVGQECGKGKLANGGGGSYSGNTGAGGGANSGKGGNGGWEYNGCGTSNIFSIGGQAITHKSTALLMGGGGGGPQSDNGQPVFKGGNGGGIVYIKANQIVGNSFSILSNGGSVPTINDEGSAAGGAGGSIYLQCPTFTGPLNIETKGGAGGSNNNTIFTGNCHGPGGGGGGGLTWFSNAILPAGVTVNSSGGASGLVLNPLSPCFNTSYNAQSGDNGEIKFNFVPIPPPVLATINIGNDTVICAGSSITLDAGAGFIGYVWDNSATSQTRSINTPGTFFVTVTEPSGCSASDTIVVTLDNSLQGGFTFVNQFGCEEDTIQLVNTSVGATQYLWDFGDGDTSTLANPSHVYTTQGIYTITLIAGNLPCFDTIQLVANTNHPIEAVFGMDRTTYCVGSNSPLLLTSTSTYAGILHLWEFGDGATATSFPVATHDYTIPGVYTIVLTITDSLGCIDTMSNTITVFDSAYAIIVATDSNVCLGDPIHFTALHPAHLDSLQWNFGDGNVIKNDKTHIHTYDVPGNFVVTLTGYFSKCTPDQQTDDLNVSVLSYPRVSLGADTSICPGVTSAIFLSDVNSTGALYEWSTGETTNVISVAEAGHYWVKASNGECSTTDSIWVKRDCYLSIPNAFSPDADGRNDYFLPRELLASGLTKFSMKIFNRWGEQIFTTTAIDGRGWDGKYNDKPQPMGVYVYVIDVQFENALKKTFKGNVTLVR